MLASRLIKAESIDSSMFPNIFDFIEHVNKPMMFFDTETSGLAHEPKSEILEFASLHFYPDREMVYNGAFIKNKNPIPHFLTEKVHGITAEMIAKEGIDFKHFHESIKPFFEESIISGFNTRSYDMKMLTLACQRASLEEIQGDQLDVRDFHIKITKSQKGKLSDICDRHGIKYTNSHHAMDDTIMSAQLFDFYLSQHGLEKALSVLVKAPEKMKNLLMEKM